MNIHYLGGNRLYTVKQKKKIIKSLITMFFGHVAARYSEVNHLHAYQSVCCFSF